MSKKLIQAAAGAAGGESVYVEDVFSTYLYTSTGSALTITNGIDLSGEGGLVWIKDRDAALNHVLIDTERGKDAQLYINTSGQITPGNRITAFNSNGFTLGTDSDVNTSSARDYCSWTFRKQAGFFDVITWTGDGSSTRTLSHNLDANIGAVLIKGLNESEGWVVAHRSTSAGNKVLQLNTTSAETTVNHTYISGSTLTVGTAGNPSFSTNDSGINYVAYLFAHDDQSFGDDSDESIIKCGSFTAGTFYGLTGDLGWEPQWFLVKESSGTSNWTLIDNMRGIGIDFNDSRGLRPNTSSAEENVNIDWDLANQGTRGLRLFGAEQDANQTYIYIAIRRPMKTPESGTEVFKPVAYTGNSTAGRSITCGFPLDVVWTKGRTAIEPILFSRLQGSNRKLLTYSTAAEASSGTNTITSFDQDGMTVGTDTDINSSSYTYVNHFFKRAKGFMDVVAYTGNASARALSHNLGVAPELLIFKTRSVSDNWLVASTASQTTMFLNLTNTDSSSNYSTKFTSFTDSVINLSASSSSYTNENNKTYVCYMFATLAGVSKCGIYTGTGAVNTIDCGFSSGARYVMIKSRDNARDWFVWDSARGIVAGNDPYLKYNATSGETSVDYIDPENSGFQLSGANDANQSGEKYIFLAIA